MSAEKLPPNTFTNRLEQQSGLPSAVTVILLDAKNTKLTDQIYIKQEVLKYLRTIKPEDHIGAYAIGDTLEVLHDYTTQGAVLRQTIEKSAQASMLRVVMRDAAGNIGSVTVPFARLDR